MPASWATSCRRRPGVRRRWPAGSPTSAGRSRSLRERRKVARSSRFMPVTPRSRPCSDRIVGAGLAAVAKTGTADPRIGRSLPAGRRRWQARDMTTIALITGANKGIGFATARLLGDRGWTILLGARDEVLGTRAEQELAAAGADARFVRLDVTDEQSVAAAAAWSDPGYGTP